MMGFSFNPAKMSGKDRGGITSGMGMLDPMDVSGAGARSSAEAQREAARLAAEATKQAAEIAAQAIRDANAANLAAQKEATAEAIAAAKEANTRALQYVEQANAQAEAAVQAGADFSDQQFQAAYDQIKTGLTPWIDQGRKANERIDQIMFGTAEERQNALQMDPGYDFRMQQGQQALERSAAARGNLFSGNTGQALVEYGQNFASDEFSNAFNRLMGLSQQGKSATSELNQSTWNLAANKSANRMSVANTRAQNAMNYGNAGSQGQWNISNARSGGAQNNASVAIAGQNALANTVGQGAYNVAGALGDQYAADAGATIFMNNERKANATNAINTVASLYGMGGIAGGNKSGGAKYNYNDMSAFSSDGRGNYYPIN